MSDFERSVNRDDMRADFRYSERLSEKELKALPKGRLVRGGAGTSGQLYTVEEALRIGDKGNFHVSL